MKPRICAILLLAALALAPWLGGKLTLEPQPIAPEAWLYEMLIARMTGPAAHLILAILVVGAICIAALRRQVVHMPTAPALLLAFALWVWLAVSILGSEQRHDSILEFAKWTVYLMVMLACTMTLGRTSLPRAAALAIGAGVSVVALGGVYEFVSSGVPNWRIFAGWQNPNAAAGAFSIAIPLIIALALTAGERMERLLLMLGAGACAAALWLTASKGGLLSAVFGLAALLALAAIHRQLSSRNAAAVGWVAVSAAALVLLATAAATGGSPGGSRLLTAGDEAEQSVGFRARLWKDSIALGFKNPVLGVGVGAYAPALRQHTQTAGSQLAHNTYVQIAAEAGVPGLALFLALGFSWLFVVLRRHPAATREAILLRLGVAAAVLAAAANFMVESNLSHFGFGVLFFGLLGIGFLLAVDGVMPERAPFASRVVGAVFVSLGVVYYIGSAAFAEYHTSAGLHSLQSGRLEDARSRFQSAIAASPANPLPYYHLGRLDAALGDSDSALAHLTSAVKLGPTSVRYATRAQALAGAGRHGDAENAFKEAIGREPFNPRWRRLFFEYLLSQGETEAAYRVATELAGMEGSDFFVVNAIPWLVNTETVEARLFLADRAAEAEDLRAEIAHLESAYRTLVAYRRRTYAELMRMTDSRNIDARIADLQENAAYLDDEEREELRQLTELKKKLAILRFGGESLIIARERFRSLETVAERLMARYRDAGDASSADAVSAEMSELRAL